MRHPRNGEADGDRHGYLRSADFQDFLDRPTRLGCPGAEDWQMLPCLSGPTTFLAPYGSRAALWRETLGLTLDEGKPH